MYLSEHNEKAFVNPFGYIALYQLTFGFFLLGGLLDFFLIPVYVWRHNHRMHGKAAHTSGVTKVYMQGLAQLIRVVSTSCLFLVVIFTITPRLVEFFADVDLGEGLTDEGRLQQSPYALLGVSKFASTAEIRTAFLKESRKWHPDRNQQCPECHDRMTQLNKAFEKLRKKGAKRGVMAAVESDSDDDNSEDEEVTNSETTTRTAEEAVPEEKEEGTSSSGKKRKPPAKKGHVAGWFQDLMMWLEEWFAYIQTPTFEKSIETYAESFLTKWITLLTFVGQRTGLSVSSST